MEHREQIEAIVCEATRDWEASGQGGRAALVQIWREVRRQLRALRDTATSLAEDERTALRHSSRLQMSRGRALGEAPAD